MATYLRDLEAAIAAELEALLSQGNEGSEALKEPKPLSRMGKPGLDDADDTPTAPRAIVGKRPRSRAPEELRPLSARIYRLDQLRRWMKDDPDLFRIFDIAIGNQVTAAEERQRGLAKAARRRLRIVSIIGSTAALIIGWLLSSVAPPATFAPLFGR